MKEILNSVRIEILKNFPTQSDFAAAVGEHESRVSQIIRGRRKLSRDRAKAWARALKCDPVILDPAVKGIEGEQQ